jgi:hypothetical protein
MGSTSASSIRAHQKAAGAVKNGDTSAQRDRREALGRSRGGYGTKACAIADGAGRALVLLRHKKRHALNFLAFLTRTPLKKLNNFNVVRTL